jgi:hypothetical protein
MKGRPRSWSGDPEVDQLWCDDRINSVETLFPAQLIDDQVRCSGDARIKFWGPWVVADITPRRDGGAWMGRTLHNAMVVRHLTSPVDRGIIS